VAVSSRVAGVFAVAGGVIHLAVIRHHVEYAAITLGFAVMGSAQLVAAAGLLTRPTRRVRAASVTLHAVIVTTWLVSRTVGLGYVSGAEDPAPFGIADTIANLLGAGVIATLVAAAPVRAALSTRAAHTVTALAGVAAVALAVPAALAPHHHADHDHPGTEVPAEDQHGPGDGHAEDGHDHG
jgi:hypothetical protein